MNVLGSSTTESWVGNIHLCIERVIIESVLLDTVFGFGSYRPVTGDPGDEWQQVARSPVETQTNVTRYL